jgi:hypothetical protein
VNGQRLTEEQIQKLLEGHKDVLTPLADKENEFFKRCSCPNCGKTGLAAVVNVQRPFSPGSPLPNKLLTCGDCGIEFDPYTKFITKAPATMIE